MSRLMQAESAQPPDDSINFSPDRQPPVDAEILQHPTTLSETDPDYIDLTAFEEFLYESLPDKQADFYYYRVCIGLSKESAASTAQITPLNASSLERRIEKIIQRFKTPDQESPVSNEVEEHTDIPEAKTIEPGSNTESFLNTSSDQKHPPLSEDTEIFSIIIQRGLLLQQKPDLSQDELNELRLAEQAIELFTDLNRGIAFKVLRYTRVGISRLNFEVARGHLRNASLLYLSQPQTKPFIKVAMPMVEAGIQNAIAEFRLQPADIKEYLKYLSKRPSGKINFKEERVLASLIRTGEASQDPQVSNIANQAIATLVRASIPLTKNMLRELDLEEESIYQNSLEQLEVLVRSFAKEQTNTKFISYVAPRLESYLRYNFDKTLSSTTTRQPSLSPPVTPTPISPEYTEKLLRGNVVIKELQGLLAIMPPAEAAATIWQLGHQSGQDTQAIELVIWHMVEGLSYRQLTMQKPPSNQELSVVRRVVINTATAICSLIPPADVLPIRQQIADRLDYTPSAGKLKWGMEQLPAEERYTILTQLVMQAGGAVNYNKYQLLVRDLVSPDYSTNKEPADSVWKHSTSLDVLVRVLSKSQAAKLYIPLEQPKR